MRYCVSILATGYQRGSAIKVQVPTSARQYCYTAWSNFMFLGVIITSLPVILFSGFVGLHLRWQNSQVYWSTLYWGRSIWINHFSKMGKIPRSNPENIFFQNRKKFVIQDIKKNETWMNIHWWLKQLERGSIPVTHLFCNIRFFNNSFRQTPEEIKRQKDKMLLCINIKYTYKILNITILFTFMAKETLYRRNNRTERPPCTAMQQHQLYTVLWNMYINWNL